MGDKRFVLMKSDVVCDHQAGDVEPLPMQGFVRVESSLVLTNPSFHYADIDGCPVIQPSVRARCKKTKAKGPHDGPSGFVFIEGKKVILSHLDGFTDGLGDQSHYGCRDPHHHLVYCEP